MNIADFVKDTRLLFEEKANPQNAKQMIQYMRNLFGAYGVKTPERKLIQKQIIDKYGIPEAEELKKVVEVFWDSPQRELTYFAVHLLHKRITKEPPEIIDFIEQLIVTKSWWDSVDGLAVWICGAYFKKHPEAIKNYPDKWINSSNMWLQRTAILFQNSYKESTDFSLLKKYINKTKHSDEFFIRKAIGWALREYSKTNANNVIDFVNSTTLKPLSHKEALKRTANIHK